MGVVIQDSPDPYGLAHNDNPYVFRSTAYTATQRFKVSILPSTFPVDPALSTVRVYPRQGVTSSGVVTTDRAYYDPSRIVQSQIGIDLAIPEANHAGYFDCPNMHYEYSLFIQEEDKIGGVWTLGNHFTAPVKSVWNGVRDEIDWLGFDSDDYDMTFQLISRKFLSDGPSDRYINSDQSAFLYFLSSDSDVDTCNIKSYDSSGVLIDSGYFTVSSSGKYTRIAIGPYDIENSDSGVWTSFNPATGLTGAAYYEVRMSGTNGHEIITFHIDQECSKFTPVRLHWLNRLGGFDSFNFNMKSIESTDIQRDSFVKQKNTFTGTRWEYAKDSRGTTDFNIETQPSLKINTDYLTEEESVWMEDFATSPIVFQELDNELIAMSGNARMIGKQTSLNDKLMQYEFELDYSLSNKRQRG